MKLIELFCQGSLTARKLSLTFGGIQVSRCAHVDRILLIELLQRHQNLVPSVQHDSQQNKVFGHFIWTSNVSDFDAGHNTVDNAVAAHSGLQRRPACQETLTLLTGNQPLCFALTGIPEDFRPAHTGIASGLHLRPTARRPGVCRFRFSFLFGSVLCRRLLCPAALRLFFRCGFLGAILSVARRSGARRVRFVSRVGSIGFLSLAIEIRVLHDQFIGRLPDFLCMDFHRISHVLDLLFIFRAIYPGTILYHFAIYWSNFWANHPFHSGCLFLSGPEHSFKVSKLQFSEKI